MAVYVICPHCFHPTVVPRARAGKGRLCRQCGQMYFVGQSSSLAADAIPVRSGAHLDLLTRQAAPTHLPVYEIA